MSKKRYRSTPEEFFVPLYDRAVRLLPRDDRVRLERAHARGDTDKTLVLLVELAAKHDIYEMDEAETILEWADGGLFNSHGEAERQRITELLSDAAFGTST